MKFSKSVRIPSQIRMMLHCLFAVGGFYCSLKLGRIQIRFFKFEKCQGLRQSGRFFDLYGSDGSGIGIFALRFFEEMARGQIAFIDGKRWERKKIMKISYLISVAYS